MLAIAKKRAIVFISLVAVISVFADQLISRGLFGKAGSLAYIVGEFEIGLVVPLAVLAWYCTRDMSSKAL